MAMDEGAIVSSQTESSTTPDGDIKSAMSEYKEFNPLYKHFDVEPSPRTDEALKEIWEYAAEQSPSKDRDSIILQVIKFNHELGTPGLGESAYSKMYNYLTVYKQFKKTGKLLEELKKK